MNTFWSTGIGWKIEPITAAEETLSTTHINDCARIDRRTDHKRDARVDICSDQAGNDIDRGALCSHDNMYACRACQLCQAANHPLHLFRCRHHQVGQFVDNHDNGRKALQRKIAANNLLCAEFAIAVKVTYT